MEMIPNENILFFKPDVFFQIMLKADCSTILRVMRTSRCAYILFSEHLWKTILENNYSEFLEATKCRFSVLYRKAFYVVAKSINLSDFIIRSVIEKSVNEKSTFFKLEFYGCLPRLYLPKEVDAHFVRKFKGDNNYHEKIITTTLIYKTEEKFGVRYCCVGNRGNDCSTLDCDSSVDQSKMCLIKILCSIKPSRITKNNTVLLNY